MKKFMIIWTGELISAIGSGMTAFAVSVYIYQITGSATWVSVAALLAYLPTIILSPVGGVLADRYDRRLMMILGDSLSALGLIFILVSVQTGNGDVLPLLIGVSISSIFISLLEPAYKATVTDLLTDDEYGRASGLVQLAGASRYLISPFLAGIILAVSDIRTILIIDIGTIFLTVLVVSAVRKTIREVKPIKDDFNFIKEFGEGIKIISSDNGVKSLVLLMAFMCFFVAFIQALLIPMILAFADVKAVGIMESVSAMGMVAGSIIIGVFNIKKNYTKMLTISLMGTGFFMALTGSTTNSFLLVGFCMLFFMALPFVNTAADVLIRIRIPNEMQGRAWGMISVLTQLGYVVAYGISGILADYVFGPMLMDGGALAGTVGRIIGTGEGRGIGFMLILSGITMFAFAFIFGFKKSIRDMESKEYELANS